MSLRRPKMQVKPKLSATRSLTPKAKPDNTSKQLTDTNSKSIDISVKSLQIEDQLHDSVDNPVLQLTTKVIPIVENIETNDDNNNCNALTERGSGGDTEPLIDPINKTLEPKETNVSEVDLKQQKVCENKSKSKSDSSRKRKMCRNNQKSDKAVMRMKDLLLYNPPMTEEQKEMKEKDVDQPEKGVDNQSLEVSASKCDADDKDTDETNSGPRVKVGTDGLLILDEESVVVKRHKPQLINESPVLENAGTTSALTNYSSFRSRAKGSSKPRWTEHETIRFYSALNTIGTDFTLMANLFFRGKRTRLDLRNKFKKEERVNKMMIDEALFSPNTFINQCPELDDLLDDSSDSDEDNDEPKVTIKPKATKSKS